MKTLAFELFIGLLAILGIILFVSEVEPEILFWVSKAAGAAFFWVAYKIYQLAERKKGEVL